VTSLLGQLTSELPWTIGGAIAAAIAAAAAATPLVQSYRRRRKLKTPCKAWFAIPSSGQRILDYVVQDSNEHYVEELTLSSHSEFEIEILYRPTIDFTTSVIYFGCGKQDYNDLETKPIIKSLCNFFVERGNKEESPESHPDANSTDRHKYYHIRRQKNLARGETYPVGFRIQTREVGEYDFHMCFVSEEVGELTNKLLIRVEDPAVGKMRCIYPGHTRCLVQARLQLPNGLEKPEPQTGRL
jgi:hypothetical protein